MRIPLNSSHQQSTYVITTDDAAELVRLVHQDYLLILGMQGFFPRQIDLHKVHRILDLACGSGGWVLEVAHAYPSIHVEGIDMSKQMIEYAQAQAWVQQAKNVEFREMNLLETLDIPDNTFDIINTRFLVSFMPKEAWPELLRECLRVTRLGGMLYLTEAEMSFSNSAACEELNRLFACALHKTGRSFSPSELRLNITPMLGYFLRQAGYQNMQCAAHVLDYSSGMQAHDAFYQNLISAYKMLKPFLIQVKVCTEEEFECLYQQAQIDMSDKGFYGVLFYLSVWGTKNSS